jgi:hypothetical protein
VLDRFFLRMIPKSGRRFSEKIMRHLKMSQDPDWASAIAMRKTTLPFS